MTPIQQIKAALHFDEYVARYLTVKNKSALCPFHVEKSPSLALHEQWGKCFGCGWAGDVVKFSAEYHDITLSAAVRMLADELGIQLIHQSASHPYDALKADRERMEAVEWRRLTKLQMVSAADYDTSLPFIEDLDAMTHHQLLAAYREQRTVEQAATLRDSARAHAKPTVESLVKEFLSWSR